MKIVIDDKIPFIRGAFEPYAEVVYLPGALTTAEAVRDADAIVTRTRTRCNRTLLEGSRVKVIASATIGYDHIDTAWCEAHGIAWSNAPGCNSGSVAQYVGSVLARLSMRGGFRLEGKVLGVVGYGHVGKKVAALGEKLGMSVLVCDPPLAAMTDRTGRNFISLDELVRESDIITLHVPLETGGDYPTLHLFDRKRLESMRPGQYLVNSSRGEVVDNSALKDILKRNDLKAVLDVWENEPDIDRELIGLLEIATPHIAGYSADGKACGTEMAVHFVAEKLGLPLSGWKVNDIPEADPELRWIAGAAGNESAGSSELDFAGRILSSYDVLKDDAQLRSNPDMFEIIRNNYPVRREY